MDSVFLQSQAGGHDVGALPGPRDEGWRYTPLKALGARQLAVGDAAGATRAVELPGALGGFRAVLINGVWREDLSQLADLPAGVRVRWQASAAAAHGDVDALRRLNTLNAKHALVVEVDAGVVLTTPLELIAYAVCAQSPFAAWSRIEVRLGDGARAAILLRCAGEAFAGDVSHLALDLSVAPRAELALWMLDEAPAASTLFVEADASVAQAAALTVCALDSGAAVSRQALRVQLAGEGAKLSVAGAAIATLRQHSERQLSVRHRARDTTSELRWRAVAADRARAVLGGEIRIDVGADGSDAALSNKNLLLSPHAEIDTKPVLEIYADEVRASHGATVGQLDERQLFYLRSRGIALADARALLTYAFCAEMLDAIGDQAIRAAFDERLKARLPSGAEPAARP